MPSRHGDGESQLLHGQRPQRAEECGQPSVQRTGRISFSSFTSRCFEAFGMVVSSH